MQEMWVQSLGGEDPLEQEMATHSGILAWKIPWTEEPGGLHTVHGVAKELDTTYRLNSKTATTTIISCNSSFTTSLFFCLPSFPAPWSFPMSWLFIPGGQSIRTLASVLSMNIQGWFPLGLTGLISLLPKGLSRVFSSTTIQKHQFLGASAFFMTQLSYSYMTTRKTIALTRQTFVGKVMSLLFNMLSLS